MGVGDQDAYDLCDNVDDVVGNDVVGDELTLIGQVGGFEILWGIHQVVAAAGPPCLLEPVVLEGDEPDQSAKVSHNDIRSNLFKHALLALNVVQHSR